MSEAGQASRAPGDLLLDRFRLVRVLGEHGVSRSWLAEDAELRETVVLRILAPELAASQLGHERLREACRQARRLHHPQIVPVHDFHRDGELCFVSREYVEEADPGEALPPEQRSSGLAGVADALAYAHGLGVVHGDIKAAKLIWGPGGVPRLADFCVAAELTRAARALGPPSTGPEPAEPSAAEDVHGLGSVLFELWTGELPVEAEVDRCAARMQACGADAALARLVEEMLAPNPRDRPDMGRVRSVLDPGAPLSRPIAPAPPLAEGPAASTPSDGADDVIPVPIQRRPAPMIAPVSAAHAPSIPRVWIVSAFAILLAMALGVFVYLPSMVNAPDDDTARSASDESGGGAQPTLRVADESETDAEDAPASEEEAKRLLGEVLELHEKLLEQGVRQWAPKEMRESEVAVEEGQSFQLSEDFDDAVARYGESRSIAESLTARAPEELAEALAAGRAALDAGQDDEAARHFELALAIEPDNAEAQAGLERAGSLDAVAALLASARRLEDAGELQQARAQYLEARELDSASTGATEGIARIDARLGEIAYARGMSGATRALAAGDFDEALASVNRALAARPGSAEAKSLRARIEASRKRQTVATHEGRARALERDGSWTLAIAEYRKALAVDPELATAQQGLARCELGQRLSRSFGGWIAKPDQLLDPGVRAQASAMLVEASGFSGATDEMRDQARQVEALVAQFSQPVRVVFESDNETEVSIQRLSKLGSFTRREVQLDPGTYVVLGIRRGYRDVRQTITVAPGQTASPVVIRCTQPI